MLVYISYVAKARLFTAVFLQLSIFTADCLCHPIQMAGVETIWEFHTLSVIYSCYNFLWKDEVAHLFLEGKYNEGRSLSYLQDPKLLILPLCITMYETYEYTHKNNPPQSFNTLIMDTSACNTAFSRTTTWMAKHKLWNLHIFSTFITWNSSWESILLNCF